MDTSDTNDKCKKPKRRWKSQFEGHKREKKVVFAGKSDLKSAFRILGLSPGSWPWLIFIAQDPISKKWMFFVDKCLPFGASISCALFQRFSDALCYLIEYRTNSPKQVTNYLDDFLFLALSILSCNHKINEFLSLCKELNVPLGLSFNLQEQSAEP